MDQKPAGEAVPGESVPDETTPESFDPHVPVGHPSAETDEQLEAERAGLTDLKWKPLTERCGSRPPKMAATLRNTRTAASWRSNPACR